MLSASLNKTFLSLYHYKNHLLHTRVVYVCTYRETDSTETDSTETDSTETDSTDTDSTTHCIVAMSAHVRVVGCPINFSWLNH